MLNKNKATHPMPLHTDQPARFQKARRTPTHERQKPDNSLQPTSPSFLPQKHLSFSSDKLARYPVRLPHVIPHQAEDAHDGKDLEDLPPLPRPHLGLDVVPLDARRGREAACGEILLHEGVLLVPLLAEPDVEGLGVVEGDVGDAELAPEEVDRLGWAALEVRAGEAEEVLAVLTTAITQVRQLLSFFASSQVVEELTRYPRRRQCSHIHTPLSP
jgi:hypothetical protein